MKKNVVPGMIAFLLGMFAAAQADVTLTQKSLLLTVGLGQSEVVTTEKIKGEMDYTRMVTKTASGRDIENITIYRLDKGLMWILTPNIKIYNEIRFDELKGIAETPSGDSMAIPDDKYDWRLDISDTRDSIINGYKCRGVEGVAVGLAREKPTEKTRIVYEVWVSDDLTGGDELVAHYKKLSGMTGQDRLMHADMARQMFSDVGPQFERLAEAVAKLKGFPVKITMSVENTTGILDIAGNNQISDPDALDRMKQIPTGQGDDGVADGDLQMVMSITTELIGSDTTVVDVSIFEIPEGYNSGF